MKHPIERRPLTQELCRRVLLPSFEVAPGGGEDATWRVLHELAAIAAGPTTTLARLLIADGIELPAPDSLSADQLNAKLWEVIRGMARHQTFLDRTDHLGDWELYEILWKKTLNEPSLDFDDITMGDSACHIGLCSDGRHESNRIHLQYYATESEQRDSAGWGGLGGTSTLEWRNAWRRGRGERSCLRRVRGWTRMGHVPIDPRVSCRPRCPGRRSFLRPA